jgi:ATP-dependent RNA helicase DDX49/DBP8
MLSFQPVLNDGRLVCRELAVQLSQQVEAFGRSCNVRHCTILGGMDQFTQSLELQRRPHIVVATPGRLADMLKTSEDIRKAFKRTAVLVVDEANRVLEPSFEDDLATIMQVRL